MLVTCAEVSVHMGGGAQSHQRDTCRHRDMHIFMDMDTCAYMFSCKDMSMQTDACSGACVHRLMLGHIYQTCMHRHALQAHPDTYPDVHTQTYIPRDICTRMHRHMHIQQCTEGIGLMCTQAHICVCILAN